MRVGISLLCAKKYRTGTENVAFNLVRNLAKVDKKNEYVIFTNNYSRDWLSLPSDRLNTVNVKLTSHRIIWFWEHLFFHLDRRKKSLDLVHFPQAGGVVGFRGKFVLTVHDLKYQLGPDYKKFRQRLLYAAWYKANVLRASMIVTVSEYVKNQILQHFSLPPEKVRVVYNGVDERFKPLSRSTSFRANYRLPDEYVLFVGATTASKNLKRTIQAFKYVREKNHLNHHFIIAGGRAEEHNKLQSYVKHISLEDFVHFIGYFPDNDLPQLYSNASLFVFTSIAEGFGIPPLEAMACGTPVVCSNTTSLPEVVGESAILVDPFSVDSIARGIGIAMLDTSVREEFVRKGFARAKMFSWQRAASEMVSVYEEVSCS